MGKLVNLKKKNKSFKKGLLKGRALKFLSMSDQELEDFEKKIISDFGSHRAKVVLLNEIKLASQDLEMYKIRKHFEEQKAKKNEVSE